MNKISILGLFEKYVCNQLDFLPLFASMWAEITFFSENGVRGNLCVRKFLSNELDFRPVFSFLWAEITF